MKISKDDLVELGEAKKALENPGLTMKLTNYVGVPIEKGLELLPDVMRDKIQSVTKDALMGSLKGALKTMDSKSTTSYPWWHKAAVVTSGAAGGALGLMGLAAELPISTTIMMRSIADIGRVHGEDLTSLESQLNCLMVFGLGGRKSSDDEVDSAYFAVRAALARAITEAAEFLAEKTIVEEGAPAIVRLIAMIAARFQVQISEKVAAQAVPLIGAVTGGTINYLFMDHFQDMSNGHFAVRKLERKYGVDVVRRAYDKLPK